MSLLKKWMDKLLKTDHKERKHEDQLNPDCTCHTGICACTDKEKQDQV